MNKEQLRIIALALTLANDCDYVPNWEEESESVIHDYGHEFSDAELKVSCLSFKGYSSSVLESILLNEVLEYTKPIEQ
jgi:hypothetical protein